MANMSVNVTYPYSEEYEYETTLERINFDDERDIDLLTNNGFIVSDSNGIKKDLKDPNSIFSPKFGQTLKDLNPFANRYRCECGQTQHKINDGIKCKHCGTKVRYVDDNFDYTGWIVLNDPYVIIHPGLFKSIEFVIGKDILNNILKVEKPKDDDGHDMDIKPPADEPYYNIGMMEFSEKFDEIMKYYINKKKTKMSYYEDIMKHRRSVFTHSIPVFTTLLRPFEMDAKAFYYEDTNSIYTMINKLKTSINNESLKIFRITKPKLQYLYDMQLKVNELYNSIEAILSGKKGALRTLIGGRYNFTSRDVIVADPTLRIDEISLPYAALTELLQQSIINILHKSYSMSYSDAYDFWYKSCIVENATIKDIINSIIKNHKTGRGIPVLINRNPTISKGSIFQMHCVKMTSGYTMGIPLQILTPLAADKLVHTLRLVCQSPTHWQRSVKNLFNCWKAIRASRSYNVTGNSRRELQMKIRKNS